MSNPLSHRVLCVDDDPDSYEILKIYLSDHDVVYAQTIAEGVKLAKEEPFSVFIIDIRLTDGTGIELCEQIRSFNKSAPILVVSGDVRPTVKERVLQAGAQAFFIKPVPYDYLADAVKRLLK